MNRFLDEILEQPAVLKDTLAFYEHGEGKALLKKAVGLHRDGRISGMLLTGMGSSFFTSYLASCLLNDCGIRSLAIDASELLHYHSSLLGKDTLLVCTSQSGESYEAVEILKKRPAGTPCLAVTNEAASRLAGMGDGILLAKAGHEEMTSTKSYVSIALVKLIYSWSLADCWTGKQKAAIKALTDVTGELLESRREWLPEISLFLGDYDYIELIGRGPAYASVMQGALMYREAVRNPAGSSLGGEFRHGPMEMVREGFRAIVFAPEGRTFDQGLRMAGDIAGFGGKVMVLTNGKPELSGPNIHIFRLDVRDEFLFALASIIPLQIMVNARAIELGRTPGYFTRGAKITRKE
jgi:glucosamine--fructose-6-phosphate aminotransferase (isomerizing)